MGRRAKQAGKLTTLRERLQRMEKLKPTPEFDPDNTLPGRVVTQWRYDREGQQFVIPVRIMERHEFRESSTKQRAHDESDTGHLEEVEFGVFVQEPIPISLVSTDIELLRQAVFEELEDGTRIEWEPYYHIQIDQPHLYSDGGEGIEFSYNFAYLGKTLDGEDMYRLDKYDRRKIQKGRPREGYDRNDHRLHVLVPYTKDIERAITAFVRELATIRERIMEHFTPEKVMATLMAAKGQKLLPAPKTTRYQSEPMRTPPKKRKKAKPRKKPKRV